MQKEQIFYYKKKKIIYSFVLFAEFYRFVLKQVPPVQVFPWSTIAIHHVSGFPRVYFLLRFLFYFYLYVCLFFFCDADRARMTLAILFLVSCLFYVFLLFFKSFLPLDH